MQACGGVEVCFRALLISAQAEDKWRVSRPGKEPSVFVGQELNPTCLLLSNHGRQIRRYSIELGTENETKCKCTCLVEDESLGADPRVPGVVLTIVEHFTVEPVICVVACLLGGAVELGLRQQQSQAIWLLFLLLELFLLQHVQPCSDTGCSRILCLSGLRLVCELTMV